MDIAAVSPGSEYNLTGEGEAIRIVGSAISAKLFPCWAPQWPGDAASNLAKILPDAMRVVILSDSLWRTKFGGDPSVIGRVIALEWHASADRRRSCRRPSAYPSAQVQAWVPLRLDLPTFWNTGAASLCRWWRGYAREPP